MNWIIINTGDMSDKRRHSFGNMMSNSALRLWNVAEGWVSAGLCTVFTDAEHSLGSTGRLLWSNCNSQTEHP